MLQLLLSVLQLLLPVVSDFLINPVPVNRFVALNTSFLFYVSLDYSRENFTLQMASLLKKLIGTHKKRPLTRSRVLPFLLTNTIEYTLYSIESQPILKKYI